MYRYEDHRQHVFSEEGQTQFLSIRDRVQRLAAVAGAVSMEKAIQGETGDSWRVIACVDRLVELGELVEVTAGIPVAGQHRIFVRTTL